MVIITLLVLHLPLGNIILFCKCHIQVRIPLSSGNTSQAHGCLHQTADIKKPSVLFGATRSPLGISSATGIICKPMGSQTKLTYHTCTLEAECAYLIFVS